MSRLKLPELHGVAEGAPETPKLRHAPPQGSTAAGVAEGAAAAGRAPTPLAAVGGVGEAAGGRQEAVQAVAGGG